MLYLVSNKHTFTPVIPFQGRKSRERVYVGAAKTRVTIRLKPKKKDFSGLRMMKIG